MMNHKGTSMVEDGEDFIMQIRNDEDDLSLTFG